MVYKQTNSMNKIFKNFSKMIHNPIMILNHLYYLLTDVRAGEIKKENDNQKGILSALSNLSRETKILELKEIVKNISEDKDCEKFGRTFHLSWF